MNKRIAIVTAAAGLAMAASLGGVAMAADSGVTVTIECESLEPICSGKGKYKLDSVDDAAQLCAQIGAITIRGTQPFSCAITR